MRSTTTLCRSPASDAGFARPFRGYLSLALALSLAWLASCHGGDPDPAVDPGRVTLWRLNRAEYDNTVRDLLGTTLTPADDFPSDDFSLGFSNIADALSVSSTHIDLYQIAAENLVGELGNERIAPTSLVRLEAEAATGAGQAIPNGRSLWASGEVVFRPVVPLGGDWQLTVLGAAPAPVASTVTVDGAAVWNGSLDAGNAVVALPGLAAGAHTVGIALDAPTDAGTAGAGYVTLDAIELSGPSNLALPASPGRASVFLCDPAAIGEALCAQEIVATFATRAWRRPLTDPELTELLAQYASARTNGSGWEEAVDSVLEAVLVSPWFLYRVEVDPDPTSTTPRPLTGWELATRLSYFLWSSMPDDQLEQLAGSGALVSPVVLAQQVDRMLADPKAKGLVDTLGVEWLYLSRVDEATPDPDTFPAFDDGLRASMKTEMSLFTENILLGDRSMMELVNGTHTWVDANLAGLYDLPAPPGGGFAAVDTPDRPGIIGRAGWLASVSYPTRTSPVRRGKWVVEDLMCEPPAPPPSGVTPTLPGDSDTGVTESVRDQLEEHRANPVCATCHVVMDGIGFGLENFDGIGRFREADEFGNPIDASGSLVTGESFTGAAQLGAVLATQPKVARCMTQKVFTFATGRAPRVEDLVFLDSIDQQFVASDYRFSALAKAIVSSAAFRYRTPSPVETP